MSTPELSPPDLVSAAPAAETSPPPEAAPAPEPWTPERALEWNRYYDRYIVGGLVVLVFLAASHKITNSTLWPLLKAGEVMVQRKAFLTTDPFSYTEQGKPWVNIPWIYELGGHAIFSAGTRASRDADFGLQIGSWLLVGLNAIVRAFTVLLLLRLRKPGPGLWWFCAVATAAMGMMYAPRVASFEFTPGGIARQPLILPETWGVLLLAGEILLLEKAFRRGSPRSLLGLIPLFLLWANLDESFGFGLLILVAGVVGFLAARPRPLPSGKPLPTRDTPSPAMALGVLAGCLAVCLVNPSLFRIYPTVLEPYAEMFKIVFGPYTGSIPAEQHAFFGAETFRTIANFDGDSTPWYRMGYYLVVVALGFLSFAVNFRRFDVGRFAIYLVTALLWGGMSRLSAEFSAVFVFVAGLNGQEWYQGRFGVEGRTSSAWSGWSVGGRAITILVLFLAIAKTVTGYGYDTALYPRVLPPFGFGSYSSEFDFEAAEFLKAAPISGQVLNLHPNQGDALIWKGYPRRKSFIDRRRGVFSPEVRQDLIAFRKAFQLDDSDKTILKFKNDPALWRPILKKYGVTVVMLDPSELPVAYQGLLADPQDFVPIYDDGRTAIFGCKDAPPEDRKYFEATRLDAAEMVFRREQKLLAPDRAPTPMTFLDRIVRNRALVPPQPHIFASSRWLNVPESVGEDGLVAAAHCFMAIREARIAIRYNPDESRAYQLLAEAYERLFALEAREFRLRSAGTPTSYAQFRYRQRLTAMNFAIQTTPPPTDAAERTAKANLHLRLAGLYRETGILDMERNELASARDLAAPEGLDPRDEKRYQALDDAITRFRDRMAQITADQNVEPQQRAQQAEAAGFLEIAIRELEESEGLGVSADAVLASLVDLYCRTGQPEKANDKIAMKVPDDPALSDGPGTGMHRQGLVSSLLGFYEATILYWKERALIQIRQTESLRAIGFGREMVLGQARGAVGTMLQLLGTVGSPGLLETQSAWEWELGLILLEAGQPKEAGLHFVNAIQIQPSTPMRPLLEAYLKKLDIPLPLVAPAPAPPSTEVKPEAKPQPPLVPAVPPSP